METTSNAKIATWLADSLVQYLIGLMLTGLVSVATWLIYSPIWGGWRAAAIALCLGLICFLLFVLHHTARSGPRLRIVSASYGAGNSRQDVTAAVQDRLRDGRLTLRVTNGELGGDPCKQAAKELVLCYCFAGLYVRLVLPENATFEMPAAKAIRQFTP